MADVLAALFVLCGFIVVGFAWVRFFLLPMSRDQQRDERRFRERRRGDDPP